MALRFQKEDDSDRAAREERHTWGLAFLLAIYAIMDGIAAFFRGESLASYAKNLAWLIAAALVYWFAAPFYHEFRIRTKEIDGKVSAIEDAVNETKESHEELLERLAAIEERLAEIQGARKI